MRKTRWQSETDKLRHQTRLLRLSGTGCAVLAMTPFLIAGLSRVPLDDMTRATGLFALLIAAVVGGRGAAYQLSLNRMHGADSLEPRKRTRREKVIDDQQSHPYVVYRRPLSPTVETDPEDLVFELIDEDRSPFVGSGELVHRWLPRSPSSSCKRRKTRWMSWTTNRWKSWSIRHPLSRPMSLWLT